MLKSGDFTSKDEVVKRFEEDAPLIKEFRQLNKLNNLTRLGFFTPSEDGKLRCSLNGFGSITSRSQPSSSKNPLGAGKWARNFIKPGWGHELFYLDYKAQEPAIQGYLSGDEKLIENSSLVVSIGGTVSFEAAFYQKPSIIMSDINLHDLILEV